MPTYEYECRRCKHQFEKFQGMKDKPLERCPKCRGKLQRLVGRGAGVLFKGSGFYATDYRSAGYKKSDRAEKAGDSKKATSSETPSTVSAPKSGKNS